MTIQPFTGRSVDDVLAFLPQQAAYEASKDGRQWLDLSTDVEIAENRRRIADVLNAAAGWDHPDPENSAQYIQLIQSQQVQSDLESLLASQLKNIWGESVAPQSITLDRTPLTQFDPTLGTPPMRATVGDRVFYLTVNPMLTAEETTLKRLFGPHSELPAKLQEQIQQARLSLFSSFMRQHCDLSFAQQGDIDVMVVEDTLGNSQSFEDVLKRQLKPAFRCIHESPIYDNRDAVSGREVRTLLLSDQAQRVQRYYDRLDTSYEALDDSDVRIESTQATMQAHAPAHPPASLPEDSPF